MVSGVRSGLRRIFIKNLVRRAVANRLRSPAAGRYGGIPSTLPKTCSSLVEALMPGVRTPMIRASEPLPYK